MRPAGAALTLCLVPGLPKLPFLVVGGVIAYAASRAKRDGDDPAEVSVDAAAVTAFKAYLDKTYEPDLVARFFSAHVSYSLVDGPADVLRTMDLGKRAAAKIASMVALCFNISTKSPSLKVETITPEKPERAHT